MFKKLLNTFVYGDKRTRGILSVLFGILFTVITCILVGVITSNGVLVIFAAAGLLIDYSILSSVVFSEAKIDKSQIVPKYTDPSDTYYDVIANTDFDVIEDEEEDNDKSAVNIASGKEVQRMMVAYKVRQEHLYVLVDRCEREKVYECPAYIWKDKMYLYFLFLNKKGSLVKTSLKDITNIYVKKGIIVEPRNEYTGMRGKSFVRKAFRPYLPTYYKSEKDSRVTYKKNLYSFGNGIWCTNKSAVNMRKILNMPVVDEDCQNSSNYDDYYKFIYTARTLVNDGVYTDAEYKEAVDETLGKLADADIDAQSFSTTITGLVMKQLITQEMAEKAIMARKKRKAAKS